MIIAALEVDGEGPVAGYLHGRNSHLSACLALVRPVGMGDEAAEEEGVFARQQHFRLPAGEPAALGETGCVALDHASQLGLIAGTLGLETRSP